MLLKSKGLRRALLATAFLAAGLGTAVAETTLRYVPHVDLASLDPVTASLDIVKEHGFLIYDTLYAFDENFKPQPQMVKEMTLSEDRKTYRFTLRDGLKWHDGQPVKAEDCIASLKRWMERDHAGALIKNSLVEMKVVDDSTFEIAFKEPFGLLPDLLSKVSARVPFMMPKRIAETDPFKDIQEYIGSGPYEFVREEWVPGNKIVYRKFKDYIPRDEPPSGLAGGKVANLDRVEWLVIRDQQTALSSLMSGEVDVWENPSVDLLPVIQAVKDLKTEVINDVGVRAQLYFNHVIPPFDNPKARQAMFWLTDQTAYLQAINGNPEFYRICASFFTCGTPMETDAGLEALKGPDTEKAKALFKEAGWDFSKPIVILDPVDESIAHPATVVTVQAMRDIGLNVDVQAMDWATMLKRRTSKEPTDKGGWNMLHSFVGGQVSASLVGTLMFSGACENGLFGWACDPKLEELRTQWALADSLERRKEIATEFSREAAEIGLHVPLGQWTSYIAYSDKVGGFLRTQDVPVFWNLTKAE